MLRIRYPTQHNRVFPIDCSNCKIILIFNKCRNIAWQYLLSFSIKESIPSKCQSAFNAYWDNYFIPSILVTEKALVWLPWQASLFEDSKIRFFLKILSFSNSWHWNISILHLFFLPAVFIGVISSTEIDYSHWESPSFPKTLTDMYLHKKCLYIISFFQPLGKSINDNFGNNWTFFSPSSKYFLIISIF